MSKIAPYGSWVSPISAADLAVGAHPVEGATFVGDEIWWAELRPDESGRYVIRRLKPGSPALDVLPAPWNARTRVHEYGGGAWTVTDSKDLVFAEFSDQRLYRLGPQDAKPVAITAPPGVAAGVRFAELSSIGSQIWAVREIHDQDGSVTRDICTVPLDGSASDTSSAIRSVVSGSDFLGYPRLSPNRSQLAWVAWDHPSMPWDGTELRVGELNADGICTSWRTVIGGVAESVLQPEWIDEQTLTVISDASGWWNLYRVPLEDLAATAVSLCALDEEFAGPLWNLGTRWYAKLPGGALLTCRFAGTDRLAIIDPAAANPATVLTEVPMAGQQTLHLCGVSDGRALVISGGSQLVSGLRSIDLRTGDSTDIQLALDTQPNQAYLPDGEPMTFTTATASVHTLVYRPRNPDYSAPEGELPPFIAFVHGGPTAHVSPTLDLVKAFFTSRGIGIVDVNYGGSTGYGRAYRDRLRGQWGVVDVEDTVAAVLGLAAAGLADPARLAIEGGSAGGWTVLAALTGTDVFACGASYFGVAELLSFVQETHDFESRYLDGLIGPLPQSRDLYLQRAPLSHVDDISCPVLLLQGLDDPIVPPSQAEMFRDALIRKGIKHAYRAYPGESHGFRKTETIIDAREAELSFYGQVMGFKPPGVPELPLWQP